MGSEEETELDTGSVTAADFDLSGIELDERYRIVELIGEGAGAKVYKAEHKMLAGLVAIKILKAEKLTDQVSRERFKREARLAMQLSHPNIVEIRAYGLSPNDEPFIIMELCTGTTLEETIKGSIPIPPQVLISLGEQLASALGYAHGKGIIHRDIKPANVLILNKGKPHSSSSRARLHVKLLDFGLAKHMVSTSAGDDTLRDQQSEASEKNLTITSAIVGTPNYMSPEQCIGQTLDARSDIYSLACVLYECATGRLPFIANTDLAVMNMHLRSQPTFEKNDKVSDDLKEIILKGLSKNPADRFQNADELVAALKRASLESSKARNHSWFAAIALVSVCILTAAAIYKYGMKTNAAVDVVSPATTEKRKLSPMGVVTKDPEELNILGHDAKRDTPSSPADFEKSEQYFRLSRIRALEQGKQYTASKSLLDLGMLFVEAHKYNLAEEPLRDALAEFRKQKHEPFVTRQIATCYLGLGNLRRSQKRPKEAFAFHQQAITSWPEDDRDRQYSISTRMLEDLIEMGRLDEAKLFGAKILAELKDVDNSEQPMYREKVWTQVLMAELDLMENKEDSANQRIDEILKIKKNEKNFGYTIESMLDLARRAINQHRYKLATKVLRTAKSIIGGRDHDKKRWDRVNKMMEMLTAKATGEVAKTKEPDKTTLRHIGTLTSEELFRKAVAARGNREYKQALDLFEQARLVALAQKEPRQACVVSEEIANTYFKIQLDPEAEASIKAVVTYAHIESTLLELVKMRKDINFKEHISKAYIMLGHLYRVKKNPDKAVEFYQLAATSAKEERDGQSWFLADSELTPTLFEAGDYKRAEKVALEFKALTQEIEVDPVHLWRLGRNESTLISLYLRDKRYAQANREASELVKSLTNVPPKEFNATSLVSLAEDAYAKRQYQLSSTILNTVLNYPTINQPAAIHRANALKKLLTQPKKAGSAGYQPASTSLR